MLTSYNSNSTKRADILRIYRDSFPYEERRPEDDLFGRLDDPEEPLRLVLINTSDGNMAGFISYWEFDSFIYVEHFAVDAALRSGGLGSKAMAEFIAMLGKAVVLEVERPGSNPMAERRIAFYRRLGFRTVDDYDYIQPPYAEDLPSVPLLLMTTAGEAFDADSAAKTLYRRVYGVGGMK